MARAERVARSSLAAVTLAAAAFVTTAVGVASRSQAANGVVVASGHWDGHAWSLSASDDASERHCLQISVDFPFTRYAPPSRPNCSGSLARGAVAFSSFGGCA